MFIFLVIDVERKGLADSKKAKRLSKEEITKQLLDSMIEKAAEIIKWYEDITWYEKKGIINVAFHQGRIFKRFNEKEKFAKVVSELEIQKTTIIFKVNVFKLCEKYRILLKSSIGLGFFKNYLKDIKAICKKK